MDLNVIVRELKTSADLAERLGEMRVSGGRSLRQSLDAQGISLWDAIMVELALYHLPHIRSLRSLSGRARYYTALKRDTISNYFSRRGHVGYAGKSETAWPEKPALFLGFSDYIYRDVLQPIIDHQGFHDGSSAVAVHAHRRCCPSDKRRSVWERWDKDAAELAHALRRHLNDVSRSMRMAEIAEAVGCTSGGTDARLYHWMLNRLLAGRLSKLVDEAAVARSIISTVRPRIVVSPDVADPRSRLYTLMAKALGIPVLDLQFGIYGEEAIEWKYCVADRVAVWGEASAQVLAGHGVMPDRMRITGSARFDGFNTISAYQKQQLRARFNVNPSRAMVVFLSQYTSVYDAADSCEALVLMRRAVVNAARMVPSVHLVVKPHPLENAREFRSRSSRSHAMSIAEKNEDVRTLIAASDAVVTLGSTATMDSVLANKLTICPVYPGWIWSRLYEGTGTILNPRSDAELVDAMRLVSSADRQRVLESMASRRSDFIRRTICSADGQAKDRIWEVVREMGG